ncbi:TfuA-like protein [Amycolatopsis carbonis]|uniref:TfuA-like protein n=1 Tax=Amycolatopsis carbonis TaxID=715471 RepID=A0A9Y2ICG3_9PSEU|nr:TfuA-like protein [Amycolatopsis sp. 2-15]WIX76984.1 TfuA-like protein [Amycolatopsis sp. 2-15]
MRNIVPHARIHGPIAHGDLLRLELGPETTVLIIDGVYYQRPAVRHKEILYALERGTAVVGASSMGALRACELRYAGMVGIGEVYNQFAEGRLDSDDEVAVSHLGAEDDHLPRTVALVSLRAACRRRVSERRISPEVADAAVAAVRELYFTERTPFAVRSALRQAGFPPAEAGELVSDLGRSHGDVKYADAEHALRVVSGIGRRQDGSVVRTAHLHRWLRTYGPAARDAQAATVLQLVWPRMPECYEELVSHELARLWKVDPVLAELGAEFSRRTGIDSVSTELAEYWLENAGSLSDGCELGRLAVATHRSWPGVITVLDQLARHSAVRDVWEAACGLSDDVSEFNCTLLERDPGYLPVRIPHATAAGWLAQRWQTGSVRRAALARGFLGEEDAVQAARRFIPFDLEFGLALGDG